MFQFLKPMKRYTFLVTILFFTVVLNSCCTKKDCDAEYHPEIVINFEDFTTSNLVNLAIYLTDKSNNAIKDSVISNYYSNTVRINNRLLSNGESEIKNYNYIIKTIIGTTDTITNISYEAYSYKINCNKCFLVINDKEIVNDYKDFSYQHKGKKYFRGDILTIQK